MPVDAALIQVAPAGRERDVQPRHLGQRDVRGGVRRQARERPCQSRDAQNAATAASRSIGIRPARSGRPAAGHEPADGIADQIVAYVSPPPSTWASSARGSSCVGAPVTRSPRSATCACATAARSASGRRRFQRLSQSRRPDSNRGSLHYEAAPGVRRSAVKWHEVAANVALLPIRHDRTVPPKTGLPDPVADPVRAGCA